MTAFIPFLLVALLGLGSPSPAAAQSTTENAEARVYFEEGNRLYTEASQAPEAQRTVLLQRALGAYVDSLRIVRSRNALFNAAIVLGELARYDEAFNYFTEYLQVEGLSSRDREEAVRRRDALRPEIAVLQVHTRPEGALLWIDRKDLAPRGETPIELALREGEHRLFLEKQGYLPLEYTETAVRGQTVVAELALSPVPVEASPPPVEP
ncbi:MAG: PEGA domain-containing protein, partial [Polyangiales bacterium]